MLSAFAPQLLVELKQRDKSKVESILTYGNKLLVGLNTGTLRVYRVNEDEAAQEASVDLLREVEKFSRKPIEQLAIIKEANLLLSLAEGYVSIYDLQSQNYELQEQLSKTKGASTFAVTSNILKDQSTGIPSIVSRLAVAVKRKLLLWSWHDTELSSSVIEITLTAAARTLTWASGTKILCGLNSGYVLVDVQSQSVTDIVGPGGVGAAAGQDEGRFGGIGAAGMGYMGMGSWVPRPLATKLTEGEMLLAKDVNTLFVDVDGKPLDRRQIQWSTAPESISFSYPYLLALQGSSKGLLEVRNPKTLSLLQSISLPGATKLHVPQPNVSLAHDGKGFLVASARCIWRMRAENYESQIDQLLETSELDEAISLLDVLEDALLEDREARLREVKMQKAEVLFRKRRYRASMDLFTEVAAPPERVIRLYPNIIAGDLNVKDGWREDSAQPDSTPLTMDDSRKQHAGSHASKDEADGNGTAPDTVKSGTPNRADTNTTDSVGKGEVADSSDAGSVSGKPSESIRDTNSLEGKDLRVAILELYTFLADTRRRVQTYLDVDGSLKQQWQTGSAKPDEAHDSILKSLLIHPQQHEDIDVAQELRKIAKLVDTTLFRAYMVERPARARSLFRIPNFCDPDVVNEKLLETGRYEDLVDFFHGKKLHRPALELLQRFGQASEGEDVPPALHGPKKTVAYLQNLPPEFIDLILEFARWPLMQDSELGMEVFLADTENAENLPRSRVLNFLEDLDPKLAVQYLEHLIQELNDLTPDFHQRLVNLYVERLRSQVSGRRSEKWTFQDDLERARWVEKFQCFLRNSRQYSTGKTFSLIPKDDPEFYEARAIVLSKMGNHRQALEIYVFKLQNHEKAEEYCNQMYLAQESPTPTAQSLSAPLPDEEAPKSIYHTLLSLYLRPPAPYQPDWDSALNILSKHGARLPASSTLDLMPPSLPIKNLESYFRGRLRTGTTAVNEARVLRGLCASEHERYRAMVFLGDDMRGGTAGRNRRVVISEERVCRVCHKRLGRSVVSVFPDDSVVHYGCANRVQRGHSHEDATTSKASGVLKL